MAGRYRLRVTTGGALGAGTLAPVTVTLVGTQGRSRPQRLRWPLVTGTTVELDLDVELEENPDPAAEPDRDLWFDANPGPEPPPGRDRDAEPGLDADPGLDQPRSPERDLWFDANPGAELPRNRDRDPEPKQNPERRKQRSDPNPALDPAGNPDPGSGGANPGPELPQNRDRDPEPKQDPERRKQRSDPNPALDPAGNPDPGSGGANPGPELPQNRDRDPEPKQDPERRKQRWDPNPALDPAGNPDPGSGGANPGPDHGRDRDPEPKQDPERRKQRSDPNPALDPAGNPDPGSGGANPGPDHGRDRDPEPKQNPERRKHRSDPNPALDAAGNPDPGSGGANPGAAHGRDRDRDAEGPLGRPLLLRLDKEPLVPPAPDGWFCARLELWHLGTLGDKEGGPPPGTPWVFPCYRWLQSGSLELREGSAVTVAQDMGMPLLLRQRRDELRECRESLRWAPFAPGWPLRLEAESVRELPAGLRFPPGRSLRLAANLGSSRLLTTLRGLRGSGSSWRSFEHLEQVLGCPRTPIAAHVQRHWRDDAFVGAQFLTGVNPLVLRRCHRLPPTLAPAAPEVAPALGPGTSLEAEMEGGRLFVVDFSLLRGLGGHEIEGEPQFSAAPVALLHLRPDGDLVPVAIQLCPTPSAPVFVPSDPPWDWLLAKLWLRSGHFQLHEMVTHLLQSHFLGEAFALATRRCLPACHPLHKLLLPHGRLTFHINIIARQNLLNPGGLIDQATSIGREGTLELVARATAALTYEELCVPEDLARRGVTSLPRYYYRDDALRIWGAIESFVTGIVTLYYDGDGAVRDDPELQDWVGEIFTNGVLGNKESGFPSELHDRPQLIKFLTMIIFCCSARHAAVNSGQYDFSAWMPNAPATMRRPPPQEKGRATAESVLATLPSAGATGAVLALLSVVSYEPGDLRPLGCYPEELFTEEAPRRLIGAFQRRLAQISRDIRARNETLELPYPYLDPADVQNSVSI